MSLDDPHSPLVTVVIPAYNYGHYIGQTLDSVMAQTYRNWECVVVDDGSTDDTAEVVARVAERDGRVKYFHQKNRGMAAARNEGLRRGVGEYIQFLDSDDLLESRKLERQVEYLEQNTEVDIVYSDVRYFRTEEMDERLHSFWGEDESWMPKITREDDDALEALVRRTLVVHAPLLRRSVIETVGFFDETMKVCEDWLFWVRCAAQGKKFRFECPEGTLALVRAHPASITRNERLMTTYIVRMRRKFGEIIRDRKTLELNRQLAADYQGHAGGREVAGGNLARGMWQLAKAGLMTPGGRDKMKWFFCAAAAPFTPRRQFAEVISSPVRQSVTTVLRRLFRGAS